MGDFFGILLLITIHVKLIDIVYNFAIEIGAALFIKLKFSKTA
jgi:hypothetical protein